MNINLNNYEEYFLLYADNELSGKERKTVEEFVQANHHLKKEFNSITSTVILPDETLRFNNKSSLYKSTSSGFIDENNYEEIFILYHDSELNVHEQGNVETFLLAHPQLKEEFTLIGLARIQPGAINFPEKSSLYKKVTPVKTGRIIFFRMLAAATIAGLVLWASLFYFQENTNDGQVAVQTVIEPVMKNVQTEENNPEKENKPESKMDDESTVMAIPEPASPEEKVQKAEPVLLPQKTMLAGNAKAKPVNHITEKIKAGGNLEREMDLISEKMERKLLAKISPQEIPLVPTTKLNPLNHIDTDETGLIDKQENFARTVVYLDVEKEETDSYFLNIPANECQKTKVGIFLKKVKRVAERNDPIRRLFDGEEGQIVINK